MTFQSRTTVKPPEKGSFPLDHDGECREFMKKYMKCLRENRQENTMCREQSMAYLNCRMEKNLMLREDWKKLGYSDLAQKQANTKSSSSLRET
ncbi:hypothetical protein C0Q70_01468 [Pomacea canaliculata]|uniref:Cytochrome c oxidase assembly protein COX19 n=2 Tax=Pomacea canaliculata TaxID=400727 RepID=A0A2T7PZJ5_POMCA|nr:hypothetical protein C0Q70_01468 [Pomacea canaliculata]